MTSLIRWSDQIRCAKCNKPVDKVVREQSFECDTVVYKVWCHGDTDTCELTHMILEEMVGELEPGYAFTTERLERK